MRIALKYRVKLWMTNFPYPWETGVDTSLAQTLLWVALALGLALAFRRKYLAHDNLYTDVTPGVSGPL
ncbi:MAG TPA: hypothetical protein VE439_06280 [Anaerolineae bacterium]|nr:hypothetical protein [Anaerolineae bacterium]